MFRSTAHNKLTTQIVSQVRGAILSGKLKPGHRLPPEKEMLLQFGVSKHTLREALRALESMGFVEIRQGAGGGPVVSEIDMDNTRDVIAGFLYFKKVSVRDLCEVRKVFEPYLAQIAVERLSSEDIEHLKSSHAAYRKSLDRKKPDIKGEVDFHVQLARASGNPVMVLILDFVNSLLTDIKSHLKPGPDFSEQVVAAHQDILDSIVSGDGKAAADCMYRHACDVEEGLMELMADYNEKRNSLTS
ncbi:MAG: FadR family transcriptional regulator [Deltaproteobacteria bacterium]|nr:FadR family transcriptional regulator [Deltaproteobacteria bacterium]